MPCVFLENITYPLVRLGLVDIVDVDEYDLAVSDIQGVQEKIGFFTIHCNPSLPLSPT